MANLKHFNSATGKWEEIKVSTKFKDLLNTEKLTQDQNYVNIGITSYNPVEDVIFVFLNSTWLQKDQDYVINGGLLRIESKDGSNWSNGDTFNFVVLKNVDKDDLPSADGSLIQNGSITIAKLASSLQTYINKIGTAELATVADDLSGAVNELNSQLSDMVTFLDKYIFLATNVGEINEDWSPALQKALDDIKTTGGNILCTQSSYSFRTKIIADSTSEDTSYGEINHIKIYSEKDTTFNWNGTDSIFLQLGLDAWLDDNGLGYVNFELKNIKLNNNSSSSVTAISSKGVRTLTFNNLKIDQFDIALDIIKAWRLSTLEKVYIRSTKTNAIGIQIWTGTNNISYNNCGIMECDIGVKFTGNISGGHIISNKFANCDFESCGIAVYSDTQRNLINTRFLVCHFENNTKDFEIHNNNTIMGFKIDNCYFLSGGDIQIGTTDNNGYFLYGISFYNNTVIGDGTNTKNVKIGYDCPNMIFDSECLGNTYLYTAVEQIPSAKLNGSLKGVSRIMPMYTSLPSLPWGKQDTKGVGGEIRYDEINLYVKTPTEWKLIPFRKRHDYPDTIRITGYSDLSAQSIGAWGNLDITFTVSGIDKQIGWVISINPYSYLEPNIAFSAWVSGTNTISLRLHNNSGNATNVAAQRWFYILEKIDN
jgi:hypothetical protein